MRTIVLSVMTWIGAVNAAQSKYFRNHWAVDQNSLTIPRELWEKLLGYGERILKEYDAFCTSVYTLSNEAEVSEALNMPRDVKNNIAFAILNGEWMRFAGYMEDIRTGLSGYLYVGRDKRMAVVKRHNLSVFRRACRHLVNPTDDTLQKLTADMDRWIAWARSSYADKPEAVREEKVCKLAQLRKLEFIKNLQTQFTELLQEANNALEQGSVAPFKLDETFEEFVSSLNCDQTFVERGLNVLGATFIQEGGLKDILEGIINDDAKFDAILETLRDYFGDEVLNPSHRASQSTSPSVSDQDDGPDLLLNLMMRPDLLSKKLMNLNKIFPPIGRTSVFRKLCRVFMMRICETMLKTGSNLPEFHSHGLAKNNVPAMIKPFAIAYEYFSKKVTSNMNEGFDKRLREVEGIKGPVTIALQSLLIVLKEPYNVYEKFTCKRLILQFLKETKAIIEKRGSTN